MKLYNQVSQQTAENVTKSYSTSFSMATRLLPKSMRQDIYNIYGLVRIADEVVDSYTGANKVTILDQLEQDIYQALRSGYSTNLIVQAFAITARQYGIDKSLVQPFFASMRTDITKRTFSAQEYEEYIYGSAEVVGLMCLKVFCSSAAEYKKLGSGAKALGAAFQKINFLRDFADDYKRLGRCYFPNTTFDTFNDAAKAAIIEDINRDLVAAHKAAKQLPVSARPAVMLAVRYYNALLKKLTRASANELKHQRLRVPDSWKLTLYVRSWTDTKLRRGY